MSAIPSFDVDEARLTRAVAAGDADAFDALYRLYARRLAAYAGRIAGDPSAGEDVAQIALLSAYEALRRGTKPRHPRAWLYRIAHNAALEARRRRPVVAELDEEHEPSRDDETSALRAVLVEALSALPERQRAAYLLREVQGLRVAEIAAELDLTTEQVEQALFAARNRLAEQLTFGRRLDCDAVRELRVDALDLTARRALKSHVRSCPSCRTGGAARGVRLVALAPLSALRDAAAWLVGGGVPAAAKVGAVAAAAAVAAAPPVVARLDVGETGEPARVVRTHRPVQPAVVVEAEPREVDRRRATKPEPRLAAPLAAPPAPKLVVNTRRRTEPAAQPVPKAPPSEPDTAPEPPPPAPEPAAEEPIVGEPIVEDPAVEEPKVEPEVPVADPAPAEPEPAAPEPDPAREQERQPKEVPAEPVKLEKDEATLKADAADSEAPRTGDPSSGSQVSDRSVALSK